jgi:hypothetical protein
VLVDALGRSRRLLWFDRTRGPAVPEPWPSPDVPETWPSPLFDGPFIRSAAGSGIVELRGGGGRRVLDVPEGRVR